MFRIYCVLVVVAVFALLMTGLPGVAVAGPVMIDSFNVGQGQQVQVKTNSGTATQTLSGLDTNEVIGGVRRMDIPGPSGEQVSTPLSGLSGLNVLVTGGELSFGLDDGVTGSVVLTYAAGPPFDPDNPGDFVGLGNGNGVSLIPMIPGGFNPYFAFEILSIDQETMEINVGLRDASSNQATAQWTGNTVGLAKLPFSQFSGVDFANITQVTLEIVGREESQDLTLDSFYTSAEVPEPSTVALFVLGAAAFYGTARLRNRKRKSKS